MKFLPVLILAVAFVGVAVADRRDRQLCYLARKMKFVYYAVHDVFYTVHSIEKKIDDCPCGAAGYHCGQSCLSSSCSNCCETGEVTLNLTTGTVVGSLPGLEVETITETTTGDGASVDCNYRARLKATFEPETSVDCRNLLKVDMEFGTQRSSRMFNLGDSATNDGFAGDAGTQSNDAEIDEVNGNVRVYRSGQGSCDSSEIALHTDAVSSDTNHATVWLAHNYYRLKTNRIDTEMCDECLFDLNDGADDEGSVNRDIYLAFNRVISGRSDCNGYGTCMVKLAWVCNVVNNN